MVNHDPKRILFAAHSALQGGAELCLDTTLRHLGRTRHEPYAIFPFEGPMAKSARDLGIPVEIVPLNWWIYWPHSAWYFKKASPGSSDMDSTRSYPASP